MNIGLNSSLLSQKPDDKRYKWDATHCVFIKDDVNALTTSDFSHCRDSLSGAGSTDLGDNYTVSFWIKPEWTIGTRVVDGVSKVHSHIEGHTAYAAYLFEIGTVGDNDQRIHMYNHPRSASSTWNRLVARTMGDDKYNSDAIVFHSNGSSPGPSSNPNTNTVIGLGTNTGLDASYWSKTNPGSVNSEGFAHIAITRTDGLNDHNIYWNGSNQIHTAANYPTSDDDPDITDSVLNILRIGGQANHCGIDGSVTDATKTSLPAKYRDFAVWDSALSASNVVELYNSGSFYDIRTSSTAAVAAPSIYYPLNHNTADYMRAGGDLRGDVVFAGL